MRLSSQAGYVLLAPPHGEGAGYVLTPQAGYVLGAGSPTPPAPADPPQASIGVVDPTGDVQNLQIADIQIQDAGQLVDVHEVYIMRNGQLVLVYQDIFESAASVTFEAESGFLQVIEPITYTLYGDDAHLAVDEASTFTIFFESTDSVTFEAEPGALLVGAPSDYILYGNEETLSVTETNDLTVGQFLTSSRSISFAAEAGVLEVASPADFILSGAEATLSITESSASAVSAPDATSSETVGIIAEAGNLAVTAPPSPEIIGAEQVLAIAEQSAYTVNSPSPTITSVTITNVVNDFWVAQASWDATVGPYTVRLYQGSARIQVYEETGVTTTSGYQTQAVQALGAFDTNQWEVEVIDANGEVDTQVKMYP